MQYKIKILVLMASTPGRPEARINAEARAIKDIIEAPGTRDRFSIDLEPAARPADLLRALRDHAPDVVHFCGHGDDGQLFLHDHDGDAQPVSPDSLAELFRASGHRARLVVFNVCRSLRHAEAVIEHVDCAIGVATAISDRAAVEFTAGLYRALVAGKPVASAYEQAFAVLGAAGLAMPGAPDMRCLFAAGQRDASALVLDRPAGSAVPVLAPARGHGEIKARSRRRWARPLAAAAAVVTLLIAGLTLLWPPLTIPEFPDGAGIVVVAPRWLASGQEHEAYAHLTSELQRLCSPHVVAVERPRPGTGDDELVRAARKAGASLVIMFESGPTLRIVPIPGNRGTAFIEHIRRLNVASEDTRKLLAPILFALAWSAVNEPTALPAELDIPIPSNMQVPANVIALAIYLRHLKDPMDATWHGEARPVLERMAEQCRQSRNDWTCAMTRYLRYGLVCPDCDGAEDWFRKVADDELSAIGHAAKVELMERRCGDDPGWVEQALQHENGYWGQHDCGRLALAGPASCLVIEHGRNQSWLDKLARPEFADFEDRCGDMPARILARKATHYGNVGQWDQAVSHYAQAMARSPASKAYALDWIAALLQVKQRPADLVELVTSQLDIESIDDHRRIHAEFLWWLLTGDHGRADARICSLYRGKVADGRRAMPRLGHLGKRLCAQGNKHDVRCQVYEILIAGRTEPSANELCCLLSRAATGHEQSCRGRRLGHRPDSVDDTHLFRPLQ